MVKQQTSPAMRARFDKREFAILTGAGVLSSVLVIPYALTLLAPMLHKRPPRIPLPALLAIQTLQTAILIAVAVAAGLVLARRCGLGAPVLERWLAREGGGGPAVPLLTAAAVAGVLASLAVLAGDKWLFATHLPKPADIRAVTPPAWQGFLASFYGGITEELLLRLGLMSFFAWLLARVRHDAQGLPTADVFWLANLFTAVLFGLWHLPATAGVMPLTKAVVIRAIVLNGIPGFVFGHLYWKRGLESAMVAHFSGDLILHVFAPLATRWLS